MLTKDDIVSKLNIGNLPSEKQDDVIRRLESIIQRRIVLKTATIIGGKDILETMSDSEMLKVLRKKIPNLDVIVEDVSVKTIQDFIKRLA